MFVQYLCTDEEICVLYLISKIKLVSILSGFHFIIFVTSILAVSNTNVILINNCVK